MFDLRGEYDLHQSNGAVVELHIDQDFPVGDGSSSQNLRGSALARSARLHSTALTGRTIGNQVFLVITWNTGSVGEYHGTFIPTEGGRSRVSGNTFDRAHPESQASWFIDRDFRNF